MARPGRQFEEAIYAFVRKLNPDAKVLFDHHVPDREVGTPRQCDVWIETTVCAYIPVSVYVSCKDHAEKLDISDIDTFIREKDARGAGMGIIYSRAGFTAPAIEKAKKNGVSCCRFYDNKPADIPEVIWFHSYHCHLNASLAALEDVDPDLTWGDVFDRPTTAGTCFAELIIDSLRAAERSSKEAATPPAGNSIPQDFAVGGLIPGCDCNFEISATWKFYKGRGEAHFLQGSFDSQTGEFTGSISTPAIDMHSSNPGDGWEEMERPTALQDSRIMVIKYGARIDAAALRAQFGSKKIRPRSAI